MLDTIKEHISEISVEEVKASIESKENVALLDVRTASEYSRGKIEGGINLPVDKVASTIESIIPDKSKKVYVYCFSGSRSAYAVNVMVKLGYTNVCNITNGLLAWKAKGFTISP